jgi:hypothetical protein
MHNGTVLSEATDHPANKAQTGRSDDGYRHRYFELDEALHNAVVWASFLDTIVEEWNTCPACQQGN